jgi:hypothetical protein
MNKEKLLEYLENQEDNPPQPYGYDERSETFGIGCFWSGGYSVFGRTLQGKIEAGDFD